MTVVAVMQPYFLAYTGYYRLMAAADIFIIFDCVQFPRRGWVHRNRFPDSNGVLQYLTLPLVKAPQSVRIKDLGFATGAELLIKKQIERFPILERPAPSTLAAALRKSVVKPAGSLTDFLESQMQAITEGLELKCRFVRSSSLNLNDNLKGSDRVIAAARAVGAKTYINAFGGRKLYATPDFSNYGLDLRFLPEWEGSNESILSLLMQQSVDEIAALVGHQTQLCQ